MSDLLDQVFDNFENQRNKPLHTRFPGTYRALVVETNDPLNAFRVRFKCPELHDADLAAQDCPWAVPALDMGNYRSGRWAHPCIGDMIFIQFEKGHPYSPIWTAAAPPTRRKAYVYASIYGVTPSPVDEQSNIVAAASDYNKDYLPKDGRPMSHGWSDRYGNLDVTSSVGYFPTVHAAQPPPPEVDGLTASNFNQSKTAPIANNPDSKWTARISKYGHAFVQSDVGYQWNQEFIGDFTKDEDWETNRWKYWQKVLHENKHAGDDQRRMMLMTRYGHKIEMRDVGWNHTRNGEFDTQKKISTTTKDERWIKSRTKGGHLIEQIDIGFDDRLDEFVSRLILDEVAAPTPLDQEDKFGKDARQIRIVTRSGRKIVLDDRLSSPQIASHRSLTNDLIGYGILIKGRASPGASNTYAKASGNPKGYFWEMNERPGANHSVWGSPLGQMIEISDNNESMIMCTRLPALPMTSQFLAGNEFMDKNVIDQHPQGITHHLLLDLGREVVRLKSRAGHGQGPAHPLNGTAASGTNAGIEVHDAPAANPWVEIIDHDNRGLWFSRQQKLGIWRSKPGTNMYMWMNEANKSIVIRNGENGTLQIYCAGNVQLKAGQNVTIQGAKTVGIKASQAINMQVGGGRFRFGTDAFDTNVDVRARTIMGFFPQIQDGDGGPPGAPSGSGASVSNISAIGVPTSQPSNRL